jgi:hypothetical protein
MEQELISKFCEGMFPQHEIGKHLTKHLLKISKEDAGRSQKNYCHVEVEAYEFFLHLLVRADGSMRNIDQFLRDIWLECCGHLSNFGHNNFKINMNDQVEEIFQPRIKIYYDYDYGTTTRVFLRAHKQYQLHLKDDIFLLSRNEPLNIMCTSCKKYPATNMCTVCLYDKDAFFCEKCSEKHAATCEDYPDYAEMPIVNSPRMGECGYTGGSIDIERDGPYKID